VTERHITQKRPVRKAAIPGAFSRRAPAGAPEAAERKPAAGKPFGSRDFIAGGWPRVAWQPCSSLPRLRVRRAFVPVSIESGSRPIQRAI